MSTTITVSKRVKMMLERAKLSYEKRVKRSLTWNNFFEEFLLRGAGSCLELSDEEAEVIMKLTVEGRESWRGHA